MILKSFIVLLQEIVNILGRLLSLKEKYLFFVGVFIKFVYFNVSIVSSSIIFWSENSISLKVILNITLIITNNNIEITNNNIEILNMNGIISHTIKYKLFFFNVWYYK